MMFDNPSCSILEEVYLEKGCAAHMFHCVIFFLAMKVKGWLILPSFFAAISCNSVSLKSVRNLPFSWENRILVTQRD